MNSTDDANDMDGMGGMVNAGATDGVECWETARANFGRTTAVVRLHNS